MKRTFCFSIISVLLIIYSPLAAQAPFHLDTTFQVDMNGEVGSYWKYVSDYLVEPDGSIIIVGNFQHWANGNMPASMVKLHSDGSLAFDFENVHFANTCIYKCNGMYYLGSQFGPGVVRVFPNGDIDTNFYFPKNSFFAKLANVSDIYVYPDGKVLIAGWFGVNQTGFWGLIQLMGNGSLDSSFYSNIIDKSMDEILPLTDGKFIITGIKYDMQETRTGMWRIYPDGRLDTTFDAHITSGSCWTATIVPGTDKLIVCGNMNIPGYPQPLKLVRFNTDGSVDPSFYFNNQFDERPSSLIYLGNKILVGGPFREINGNEYNSLAVFDTNGVLDTVLSAGLPSPDTSLPHYTHPAAGFPKMQGDKVLVLGSTNIFSGFYSLGLIRLYGLSVGMEEKESDNTMRIYPNPASIKTRIDFEDKSLNSGGIVKIVDYLGREVASFPFSKASTHMEVATSSLSPGLYIICAEFENGKRSSGKLVVK